MAITLIGHAKAISTDTYNCSVTSSSIGADFGFCAVPQSNRNAPGDFTDHLGNVWTRPNFSWGIPLLPDGGMGGPFYTCNLIVYFCVNPITSATHTLSLATHGEGTSFGDQRFSMLVAWFSGISKSVSSGQFFPYDITEGAFEFFDINRSQHATTGSEATTFQIDDTLTPSEDNCLVLTMCTVWEHLSGVMTIDSGMTILDQTNTEDPDKLNYGGLLAYKIQTSAAAIRPTITSPTATWAIIGTVIFRSNGVAPTPPPAPPGPPAQKYVVPVLIGCPYTSKAQLLRPDYGQDAGAQAGPAFGKLRRLHQYSVSVYKTRQVDIGVEFGKLRPINFKNEAGATIAAPVLSSGIFSGGLEGRDDFEGKIAWQQDRPTPGIFLAVAGYLQTQDK